MAARADRGGAVLALLRGFGALVQDILTATLSLGVAYDAWFAIAGLVFATAINSRR